METIPHALGKASLCMINNMAQLQWMACILKALCYAKCLQI
jgi:hypothetical protein